MRSYIGRTLARDLTKQRHRSVTRTATISDTVTEITRESRDYGHYLWCNTASHRAMRSGFILVFVLCVRWFNQRAEKNHNTLLVLEISCWVVVMHKTHKNKTRKSEAAQVIRDDNFARHVSTYKTIIKSLIFFFFFFFRVGLHWYRETERLYLYISISSTWL